MPSLTWMLAQRTVANPLVGLTSDADLRVDSHNEIAYL